MTQREGWPSSCKEKMAVLFGIIPSVELCSDHPKRLRKVKYSIYSWNCVDSLLISSALLILTGKEVRKTTIKKKYNHRRKEFSITHLMFLDSLDEIIISACTNRFLTISRLMLCQCEKSSPFFKIVNWFQGILVALKSLYRENLILSCT